mmetsp:Transcript_26230/g.73572  ORF Transcript_26230/g.73572 Transcript_26230/m.73572 type:complete len:285 (-) Transcript_26230:1646-2500(-)
MDDVMDIYQRLAASISSLIGLPKDTAQQALYVLSSGLFFLLVNYGMRMWPFSHLLLRLLKRDPATVGRSERRKLLHHSATKLTGHLHNTFAVPVGIYLLLSEPKLRADPFFATTPLSYAMVVWSAGYFVHDLVNVILFYDLEGFGFLMHGFFCCGLFCYGVFTRQCQYFGASFIIWEASSPFVHLRWFLYEMGLKDSKPYFYNGLAMILSFFLARNVLGLYSSYVFWTVTEEELRNPQPKGFPVSVIMVFRVANICLTLLNAYWLSLMVSKALKVITAKKDKGE